MLKFCSHLPALLASVLCLGAEGIVGDWDFSSPRMAEVLDASAANNPGRLYGTARVAADELGLPVLAVGPGYGGMAVADSDSLDLTEELTIAFWFCPESFPAEDAPGPQREMALVIKNWNWYICLLAGGQIYSVLTDANDTSTRTLLPVTLAAGEWHHLAMTYSVAQGKVTYYLDGNPVATRWATAGLRHERGELRWGSAGSDYYPFHGRMAGCRVFDRAMTGPEIGDLGTRRLKSVLGGLRRQIAALPASPARTEWLSRYENATGFQGYRELDAAGRRLLRDSTGVRDGLSVWTVPPISGIPVLPDSFLPDRALAEGVAVVAARGEFESASVVLRSNRALENVRVQPGDMVSEAGGVIPGGDWDVKLVKCWYQAGFAWLDTEPQDKTMRVLVPELLLNDNSLIQVDFAKAANYAKLAGADGIEGYIDISEEADSEQIIWTNRISMEAFPIRDAATLQPFDLPAEFNQQLWLTIRIPADAEPGVYTGTLAITADSGEVCELPLQVAVLPFDLEKAGTYYDPAETYTGSIYHLAFLRGAPGSIDPFDRNPEQYRKELENIRDHSITNPLVSSLGLFAYPEEFRRMLEIRLEVGLETKPLYLFGSGEIENLLRQPPTEEKRAELRRLVRSALDTVERILGHRDVYIYGIDEAEGQLLLNQLVYWGDIRDEGAKVFVSGHHGPEIVDGKQDLMAQYKVVGPAPAEAWHKAGGKLWSYGNPQGGVENPELYRRNYGLGLWLAGYDGISTYCYTDVWGNPWNDFDSATHRDINFVYPTVDGVVDTIGWAGYREAMDDIRYGSTLLRAIRESGDRALAEQAKAWLANIDWRGGDLDGIRREMIAWILRLKGQWQ